MSGVDMPSQAVLNHTPTPRTRTFHHPYVGPQNYNVQTSPRPAPLNPLHEQQIINFLEEMRSKDLNIQVVKTLQELINCCTKILINNSLESFDFRHNKTKRALLNAHLDHLKLKLVALQGVISSKN